MKIAKKFQVEEAIHNCVISINKVKSVIHRLEKYISQVSGDWAKILSTNGWVCASERQFYRNTCNTIQKQQ